MIAMVKHSVVKSGDKRQDITLLEVIVLRSDAVFERKNIKMRTSSKAHSQYLRDVDDITSIKCILEFSRRMALLSRN